MGEGCATDKPESIVVSQSLLEQYDFIKRLKQLACIKKIILFGSRARGDQRERSDIDLAIEYIGDSMDWVKIMRIIDEADTLLKIDCVDFNLLPFDSDLRYRILKEGIIVYEKNRQEI